MKRRRKKELVARNGKRWGKWRDSPDALEKRLRRPSGISDGSLTRISSSSSTLLLLFTPFLVRIRPIWSNWGRIPYELTENRPNPVVYTTNTVVRLFEYYYLFSFQYPQQIMVSTINNVSYRLKKFFVHMNVFITVNHVCLLHF